MFALGRVVIVIKYNTYKMLGIFGFQVNFQDEPEMLCNPWVEKLNFWMHVSDCSVFQYFEYNLMLSNKDS